MLGQEPLSKAIRWHGFHVCFVPSRRDLTEEISMPTSPIPQYTDFSKDVLGRYVCNGLDEAMRSTSGRPDARPFDIVIIGGGSFGGTLAQHLLYSDKLSNHRILVLEAGPSGVRRTFPEPAQHRSGGTRPGDG